MIVLFQEYVVGGVVGVSGIYVFKRIFGAFGFSPRKWLAKRLLNAGHVGLAMRVEHLRSGAKSKHFRYNSRHGLQHCHDKQR